MVTPDSIAVLSSGAMVSKSMITATSVFADVGLGCADFDTTLTLHYVTVNITQSPLFLDIQSD